MTDEKKFSFCLMPGKKMRHIAGSYDLNSKQPHYEIDIHIPAHVRDQVEVNQFLLGTPEKCQWGWDIKNKSTWPAFVTIKKDGEVMKYPGFLSSEG